MNCPNCGVPLLGGMNVCPKCKWDLALGAISPEYARKMEEAEEKAGLAEEDRKFPSKKEALRRSGYDGYWEYKVLNLPDAKNGSIDRSYLEDCLNAMGLDGWHLKCAFANELGQETTNIGINGMYDGKNTTIDQNILIFERFVKL